MLICKNTAILQYLWGIGSRTSRDIKICRCSGVLYKMVEHVGLLLFMDIQNSQKQKASMSSVTVQFSLKHLSLVDFRKKSEGLM